MSDPNDDIRRPPPLPPSLGSAEAAFAEAIAHHRADRLEAASRAYTATLALAPDHAAAHSNLGVLLQIEGRLDEALVHYRAAVAIKPDYAEAQNNLGLALLDRGQTPEATLAFRRAVAAWPDYADAHTALGMARLLAGDFAGGWREYEWRLRQPAFAQERPPAPFWDGGALGGRTILLTGEQGLGDSIQFVRYAPMVAARGGRVVLGCPQPLLRLFKGVACVEQVVDALEKAPPRACWSPLLSLPRLFGTTLATIPAAVPYLAADPKLIALWRLRLAGRRGLKVGVAWRGDPRQRRDGLRSCTPTAFAALLDAPGISVVSLQKDARPDELAALGVEVYDAGPRLSDFADTAALIANLDLIVTVETAVAHLAGALGARVWTVLPFAADWRWLEGRADSPWYPTMRLFRQPGLGDWPGVMAEAREALNLALGNGF